MSISDEEVSLHLIPTEKHYVRVGEETVVTRRVSLEELAAHVGVLEQVLSRVPFIGLDLSKEMRRAGLEIEGLIARKFPTD